MSIQLGDNAPDFPAETTEGTSSFYEWRDFWAVLFSHPKVHWPHREGCLYSLAARPRESGRRPSLRICADRHRLNVDQRRQSLAAGLDNGRVHSIILDHLD
jgi:peroxiredoxin